MTLNFDPDDPRDLRENITPVTPEQFAAVACEACAAKAAEFGITYQHGPMGRHELFVHRLDDGRIIWEMRAYADSAGALGAEA